MKRSISPDTWGHGCSRTESNTVVYAYAHDSSSPARTRFQAELGVGLSPCAAVYLCSAATAWSNGPTCGTAMHARDHARRSTR
jgi:hypothetical protein